MRRLIIVSALVLSSSVAFAQFTGPSVERDSQITRDNMGQWQDRPCMNVENGQPCEFREHMNMRSDGNRADGSRRSQMNHQGYHRDGSRGDHRQYHNNGPRHGDYQKTHQRRGDMRQHSDHRQQMHQGNRSEHRSQMHQGSRSEHRDQMHRGQGRHFNNR